LNTDVQHRFGNIDSQNYDNMCIHLLARPCKVRASKPGQPFGIENHDQDQALPRFTPKGTHGLKVAVKAGCATSLHSTSLSHPKHTRGFSIWTHFGENPVSPKWIIEHPRDIWVVKCPFSSKTDRVATQQRCALDYPDVARTISFAVW
ncbi:MAG: hypothetical protein ACK51R_10225, partial [Hyphomonadaceae bacterium]